MKDKINKILWDFAQGKLTHDEAAQQVLDLFTVGDICEWCGAEKENPNGLCGECGRFPPTGNYP